MFKLSHNCTHFTCYQSNAQNSPRQISTVCEPRTSRCSSWILEKAEEPEIKLPTLVGSPCSPRDSQESSPTPQFKNINSSALSFLHSPTSHPYMTTGKTIALTRWTLVGKVMSLLLNMLSRLVITFLPRSKHLLISWLQSPSAVNFGAPQNKV